MTALKRKCQVVMLPTEKATWPNCIWLGRISHQLKLDKSYNDSPRTLNPVDDSILTLSRVVRVYLFGYYGRF